MNQFKALSSQLFAEGELYLRGDEWRQSNLIMKTNKASSQCAAQVEE